MSFINFSIKWDFKVEQIKTWLCFMNKGCVFIVLLVSLIGLQKVECSHN